MIKGNLNRFRSDAKRERGDEEEEKKGRRKEEEEKIRNENRNRRGCHTAPPPRERTLIGRPRATEK